MSEYIYPPEALKEEDIIKNFSLEKTILTIVVRSYCHENYIEQTLSGILCQKTKYNYEIVIYDDKSKDKTREIIKSYKKRYPRLIKTIMPEENQHSKGIKIYPKYIHPIVKTKYVCICEGDDFWVDDQKIKKQVDFLEENNDFSACTHDAISIDENNKVINKNHLLDCYKKDFISEDLKRCWAEPLTQAVVYRNEINYPSEFNHVFHGDQFRASLLGQVGHLKYIGDIKPSCYRLHKGGIFSPLDEESKHDMQSLTFFWIYQYYKRIGDAETATHFKKRIIEKQTRTLPKTFLLKTLIARITGAKARQWI